MRTAVVLLALLCSLHGVGTSTSNTTIVAPEGSYAFPDKTLAVFIAGTRMRFLLQSFVRRVVAPCAGEGFGVHVYLSLLGFKDGSLQADYEGFDIIPDPETSGYSPEGLRNYVGNAIANAGGTLVYYEHLNAKEELDPLPQGKPYTQRMGQYSPYKDPLGKAIMRMWKARERMWGLAQQLEHRRRTRYHLVLWTRDDAFWIRNVRLRVLPRPPPLSSGRRLAANNSNAVWSRMCAAFGGINDKSVLMGRGAAPALMTAYSQFWAPDLNITYNAEQYLAMIAQKAGAQIRFVLFGRLPSLDAMVNRTSRRVCLKPFYAEECVRSLPPWAPRWCRDKDGKKLDFSMLRRAKLKREQARREREEREQKRNAPGVLMVGVRLKARPPGPAAGPGGGGPRAPPLGPGRGAGPAANGTAPPTPSDSV